MPDTPQSQFIAFRAGERLAGALRERAASTGVTVSQFLRTVVSERVTMDERTERETTDA